MAVDKTKRQNLTLSFLHTGPKTFREIVSFYKKLWELQDFEINTSLRTFQRDIKDIYNRYCKLPSIPYHLKIEFVNLRYLN